MVGDQSYYGGMQTDKYGNLINRPKTVSRIKSMQKKNGVAFCGVFALILIFSLNGCQSQSNQEGIHVMFDRAPKIYQDQVYFHGQTVGKIMEKQGGNGPVAMVNIQIDPKFKENAGQHWAFYVESGRLTVGRLNSSGHPLKNGDRVCGFQSKSGFTWFKVKTLLAHRIAKANRRADKLYQRFIQAG